MYVKMIKTKFQTDINKSFIYILPSRNLLQGHWKLLHKFPLKIVVTITQFVTNIRMKKIQTTAEFFFAKN